MGTLSSLDGSIRVDGKIKAIATELEALKTDKSCGWGLECIHLDFESDSTTTYDEDGAKIVRTVVTGLHLTACGAADHKHYYVLPTLQAIAKMLGPDVKFSGYLSQVTEDGRMYRYAVVNGVARRYEPTITWPDEVRD